MRQYALRTGTADYLLFVDRKAIGAVESKPEGVTLSGVEGQSAKYRTVLVQLRQLRRGLNNPAPVGRILPSHQTRTRAA